MCRSGHAGDALSGKVHMDSAAKPLVPYTAGTSVQPQLRDREGYVDEDGGAAGCAATAMTPHPNQNVHQTPRQVSCNSASEISNMLG